MIASPELDRIVATVVMGWIIEPCYADANQYRTLTRKTGPPPDYAQVLGQWCRYQVQNAAWMPSTLIQHAWQVMEKIPMRIEPWGLHKRWACARPADGDLDGCPWFSAADTAPLAICLAALKSVGHQTP